MEHRGGGAPERTADRTGGTQADGALPPDAVLYAVLPRVPHLAGEPGSTLRVKQRYVEIDETVEIRHWG